MSEKIEDDGKVSLTMSTHNYNKTKLMLCILYSMLCSLIGLRALDSNSKAAQLARRKSAYSKLRDLLIMRLK